LTAICFIIFQVYYCAAKPKAADPKECEVCIANLEAVENLLEDDKKSDRTAIEKAIGKHCTLSGFGSDWKPNPKLTSPKAVKMCYIFEVILLFNDYLLISIFTNFILRL